MRTERGGEAARSAAATVPRWRRVRTPAACPPPPRPPPALAAAPAPPQRALVCVLTMPLSPPTAAPLACVHVVLSTHTRAACRGGGSNRPARAPAPLARQAAQRHAPSAWCTAHKGRAAAADRAPPRRSRNDGGAARTPAPYRWAHPLDQPRQAQAMQEGGRGRALGHRICGRTKHKVYRPPLDAQVPQHRALASASHGAPSPRPHSVRIRVVLASRPRSTAMATILVLLLAVALGAAQSAPVKCPVTLTSHASLPSLVGSRDRGKGGRNGLGVERARPRPRRSHPPPPPSLADVCRPARPPHPPPLQRQV